MKLKLVSQSYAQGRDPTKNEEGSKLILRLGNRFRIPFGRGELEGKGGNGHQKKAILNRIESKLDVTLEVKEMRGIKGEKKRLVREGRGGGGDREKPRRRLQLGVDSQSVAINFQAGAQTSGKGAPQKGRLDLYIPTGAEEKTPKRKKRADP